MILKHNILLTGGDTIFGVGLRVLLASQPDLDVIGEPGGRDDMLVMVARLAPDLLITDLRTHDSNWADDIVAIKKIQPDTKILLVTQHKSMDAIRGVLSAGASGYVLKDATNTELLTAVRSVLAGKVYLSPSLSDNIINAFLSAGKPPGMPPHLDALTQREREILKMVAEGHTNKYVANRLNLSIKTVEKHRSNMMKKLDLHNVSALTTFAIGQGLVRNSD